MRAVRRTSKAEKTSTCVDLAVCGENACCQTGRNTMAKKAIQIPAHNIPSFKPRISWKT